MGVVADGGHQVLALAAGHAALDRGPVEAQTVGALLAGLDNTIIVDCVRNKKT